MADALTPAKIRALIAPPDRMYFFYFHHTSGAGVNDHVRKDRGRDNYITVCVVEIDDRESEPKGSR
jgi:hypothetical protein